MVSIKNIRALAVTLILLGSLGTVRSQERTVDSQTKEQLKTIMAHLLETIYVSPEIGKQLAAQLRNKFDAGAYKDISTPAQLSAALTRDLRELGHDKHLGVRYDPTMNAGESVLSLAEWETRRLPMFPREGSNPPSAAPARTGPDLSERMASQLKQSNYHFREAKYLPGNIGYINLGGFAPGQAARDAAANTMATLANSDAMIIDLRRCPGGSAEMVNFLASYFFEKEPRVLMSRYIRPTGETILSKTFADIPGKRMTDIDLYLLVSSDTASACESFPYTLQQYGRAKVVGERTAGAGYNNVIIPLGQGFSFSVSFAKPTHPRSGKGWEGEGVQPDIAVPAGDALAAAHREALQKLVKRTGDEKRKQELLAALQTLKTGPSIAANATSKSEAPNYQDYVGRYGNKEISVRDGGLYYQRIGGRGGPLQLSGKDQFALNVDAQISFIRDARGVVTDMIIDWAERDKEQLKRETPPAIPSNTTSPGALSPAMADESVLTKELNAYLEQAVANDAFSGAVLVARNGQPVFSRAFGLANQDARTPNNTETKFNLGSLNKMFTAVAIAQLAERGKLSFSDTVGKLIPDYPNKAVAEKVTIDQLLTHTSGMGNYQNESYVAKLDQMKTLNDLMPLFVNDPPSFEPGTKWAYSNAGYALLGLIIEKVSGQNYFDYVRENIFKPAGMTNTDSYEKKEAVANLAVGYTRMNESGRADPSTPRRANTATRPARGSAAGGGYSTVGDLLKFSIALQNNKLLSKKFTGILMSGKVEAGGPVGKYAYGFGDKVFNGRHIVGHNGGSPGIGANFDMFPELGYTAIVLTNYDPPAMMPVMMKIRELLPAGTAAAASTTSH